MIIPLPLIVVPTTEQVDALEAFAALAKARADLVQLHALVPTPSLASRLSAADHVLVRQYESLLKQGQGLEAAAVLALYRARPVRRAGEHRAA
jgi:hypothetical protein